MNKKIMTWLIVAMVGVITFSHFIEIDPKFHSGYPYQGIINFNGGMIGEDGKPIQQGEFESPAVPLMREKGSRDFKDFLTNVYPTSGECATYIGRQPQEGRLFYHLRIDFMGYRSGQDYKQTLFRVEFGL